jgi:protein O-GlcNAc transferase
VLVLSPSCTDEMMFPIATRYHNLFLNSAKKYTTYKNEIVPTRKLNVGYICHFFHNSVSESLLIPFLKQHNHDRIKVFCYSDTYPNEVSNEIKSVADVWHDTKKLSDTKLAKLIHNEKIDVLLELNGHCVINRYGTIAKRPAPVQISFYNHCATTGISSFDYTLLGDEITLSNSQPYYSESIYFLKGVSGVAEFPNNFPDCSPPPFLNNGYITFGSFGAAHKVNTEVVKLWCNVLKRVPTAKFYMKAGVLTHQEHLSAYKKMFTDEGIALDRIILEGHSPHREMLECYSQMDIALDTYPHAAGTTTMEAIWQGVPVITLSGERYCSQNGKSILNSVGHSELVAYSEEEFINKAVALAANHERLAQYRQCLREDFKKSPRADGKLFATKLEDAYLDMWDKYCSKNT